MKIKEVNSKLNKTINRIDALPLWIGALVVVGIIMLPILILKEGAVFPLLDQLDEIILNYVFPARYGEGGIYEQMMCGVPSTSLKPFAPGFVLLYKLFKPFTAFVLQYFVVILVAAMGTYGLNKRLTGSSIIALLAASVFALLPFRSIYGLSLSGTPFLAFSVLSLYDAISTKHTLKKVLAMVGVAFYALFSSLVLAGYAAIVILGIVFLYRLIRHKKADGAILISGVIMVAVYGLTNLDLIGQLLKGGGFVSHREEYVISGFPFFGTFLGIMKDGIEHYDSFQKFIFIPFFVALPMVIWMSFKKKEGAKPYIYTADLMIVTGLLYAFFNSDFMAEWKNSMTGMLKTFQAQRFYWLLVGGWYVVLGVSLGIVWKLFKEKSAFLTLIAVILMYLPTLFYVGKNDACIFYQNVNELNNGRDVTGYVTWDSFYAENLMDKIEADIGEDMSTYRVAHIAMSPTPALMHGFYTVDGYSNDYPLEYKHKFGKIIEKELAKNDISYDYFYNWGNRCYLFYSDFGGAYMIDKNQGATIEGMEFDLDALRSMNCKYIFSSSEILDCEEQGIKLFNVYEDDTSYWRIWVYRL